MTPNEFTPLLRQFAIRFLKVSLILYIVIAAYIIVEILKHI